MTIIAKYPVELNGHIYHAGEACAYEGAVCQRIADNFTDAEGKPLQVRGADTHSDEAPKADRAAANRAAVEKTISVMGRDGIRRALDAMNVTYSPNAKTDYLAKTLLISRGEYVE